MKRWRSSDDLIEEIQNSFRRLRDGESSVEAVRAEAQLFKNATKMLDLQMEHAKATGRLEAGIADLPGFTFGAEPQKPAPPPVAHKTNGNGKHNRARG
jgi:hypothetical protein